MFVKCSHFSHTLDNKFRYPRAVGTDVYIKQKGGPWMKKKLAVGLLSAALLVGGATAAFAATDTSKLGDIKVLYQKMFSIQKQIVDKEAEAGAITSDQATSMKSAIDQRAQFQDQALDNGQVFGPGTGMGMGMRGGFGPGLNNGQAPTQEQIDAWNKAREERIKAHQAALQNGTLVPGQGYGPGQGFGRRGGGMGGFWGTQTPAQSTTN